MAVEHSFCMLIGKSNEWMSEEGKEHDCLKWEW